MQTAAAYGHHLLSKQQYPELHCKTLNICIPFISQFLQGKQKQNWNMHVNIKHYYSTTIISMSEIAKTKTKLIVYRKLQI